MRRLLVSSMLVWFACGAANTAPVLTLDAAGGLTSGSPGGIAGWGFSLTSDTTDWVSVVTSSLIDESNPLLGVYTDLIGLQSGPGDGVLPPSSDPWVETFNFSDGTGVGYYSIDPAAPIGGTDSGLIDVLYEEFSNDPNVCPTCGIGFADLYVPFTVDVVAPTGSSAPEPSPFRLVTWGLGLFGLSRCLRRLGSGRAS